MPKMIDDMVVDIKRLEKALRDLYRTQEVEFKIAKDLNLAISKHLASHFKTIIKRIGDYVTDNDMKTIKLRHIEHITGLRFAGFNDKGSSGEFVIRKAPFMRLVKHYTDLKITAGAFEALRSLYERKVTKLLNALIKQSHHSGVKTISKSHLVQVLEVKDAICDF